MVMADFMEKFGGASGSLLSPLQITAQSEAEGVRPELRVQARAKLDPCPPHTTEHTVGAGCPKVWGVWFFPPSIVCATHPVPCHQWEGSNQGHSDLQTPLVLIQPSVRTQSWICVVRS